MSGEVAAFCILLERRTGIVVQKSPRLEHIVKERARVLGYQSMAAYVDYLEEPDAASELRSIINLVTIGKTSFARYPEHVSVITRRLVPALHEALPPEQTINIWSAGCSTGQEPYTLAMNLTQEGWYEKRSIRIVGTDVNSDALAAARQGLYWPLRTDELQPFVVPFVERNAAGMVLISASIRDKVRFEEQNLMAATFPRVIGGWHIVLCANVLIYFSNLVAASVLRRFAEGLARQGVVMLGGSETLGITAPSPVVSIVRIGEVFAYARGEWPTQVCEPVRTGSLAELDPNRIVSTPAVGPSAPTTPYLATSPLPSVQVAANLAPRSIDAPPSPPGATDRSVSSAAPAALASEFSLAARGSLQPIASPHRDQGTSSNVALVGQDISETEIQEAVRTALESRGTGAVRSALGELRTLTRLHPGHPLVCRALALLLLRERSYSEAYEAAQDAVGADPLAFDMHFVAGWLLLAMDEPESARESFDHALFLEPTFALARYELARALHRMGKFAEAANEYQCAASMKTEDSVRQKLKESTGAALESLWVDDTFVGELCSANRVRAMQGKPPLGMT